MVRIPFGRPENPVRASLRPVRSSAIFYCKRCGHSSTQKLCPRCEGKEGRHG